ncbi:MAG: hypothetical protein AAGI03_05235 [Pseudomonadota bacterium]
MPINERNPGARAGATGALEDVVRAADTPENTPIRTRGQTLFPWRSIAEVAAPILVRVMEARHG